MPKLCFVEIGQRFTIDNDPTQQEFQLVNVGPQIGQQIYESNSFKSCGWYSWAREMAYLRAKNLKTEACVKIHQYELHPSTKVTLINNPKKEKSAMDKNLAALIRDDTKTITVQFNSTKLYTYVTDLDVSPGDYVVVPAGDNTNDRFAVAEVKAVHDQCEIEPNSEIEYKWVIHKFTLENYLLNRARNREIANLVAQASRTNMRRTFAAQILAGVDPEKRKQIEEAISSKQHGNNLQLG